MKGTFKIRWTQLNQQLYLGQHLAVGWEAPNQQPWMPWIPVSRINSSHRLDFSPWSKGVFGALGSDFAESKLSMKPDPCGWFLATSRWLLFSVNKWMYSGPKKYYTLSDPHHGMSRDIFGHKFWHFTYHCLWHLFRHSDILSNTYSEI